MTIARLTIIALVLMTLPLVDSSTMAQAPSVGFTVPAAVQPGQATDVTLLGGSLEGVTRLWTSFASQAELAPGIANNGQEGGKVVFRVTTPADAPVGIGGVRVAGPRGVSELRLIMIDDLPSVAENGANKAVESAQELAFGSAVDGAAEAESFDYYKFQAVPGMRITAEVVARRLGSPLDPVLRLIDSAGRELAYSDDEPGIGADSRLQYEFAAEGTYLLEVRDIRYQGGGNHRYRLRFGDFPLVSVPYPLGATRGTTARFDWSGPAIAGLAPIEQAIPADPATEFVTLMAKRPQGHGASWATAVASDQSEQLEFEPNNAPEQASPVDLPAAINGRFQAAKDRDFYQFSAKQGQRLLFIGRTRTLGSPSDLFLRLYNAEGGQIAEAEDAGTAEGVLDYTFPADGTYRLMVEDLIRRGGPEHAYRIEVRPYQPGFSLAIEAERVNPPQQGVFVAKVTCARRDYNGPITLSLEGAPAGIALGGNVIPEGKNETVFSATLPAGIEAGQLHLLRVVGQAQIGETNFRAVASSLGTLRGQFNGLPYPPAGLDSTVAMGVGPVFADFFKLSVEPAAVQFPQLVGTTTFMVKAEKLNGFDDPIAIVVDGLPVGFAAEVKPIEKGKADTVVTLRGPAAGSLATYSSLRVIGNANFQNQPRQVIVASVPLKVVPPLAISVQMQGPLKAGGTQKAKVVLTRFGEAKPPVTLTWQQLPLGVSAPAGLIVPEGQNELEFDLTAAADAAIGPAARVIVTGSLQMAGRDVTVTSEPVALEVVMQ
jgi:hypothetical protein